MASSPFCLAWVAGAKREGKQGIESVLRGNRGNVPRSRLALPNTHSSSPSVAPATQATFC